MTIKCLWITEDPLGYQYWVRNYSRTTPIFRSQSFLQCVQYIFNHYRMKNSNLSPYADISPHGVKKSYLLTRANLQTFTLRTRSKRGTEYQTICFGSLEFCLITLLQILSVVVIESEWQKKQRKDRIAHYLYMTKWNEKLKKISKLGVNKHVWS